MPASPRRTQAAIPFHGTRTALCALYAVLASLVCFGRAGLPGAAPSELPRFLFRLEFFAVFKRVGLDPLYGFAPATPFETGVPPLYDALMRFLGPELPESFVAFGVLAPALLFLQARAGVALADRIAPKTRSLRLAIQVALAAAPLLLGVILRTPTALCAVLALAGAGFWSRTRGRRKRADAPIALPIACGLAALIDPALATAALIAGLFFLGDCLRRGRIGKVRAAVWGAAAALATLSVLLVFGPSILSPAVAAIWAWDVPFFLSGPLVCALAAKIARIRKPLPRRRWALGLAASAVLLAVPTVLAAPGARRLDQTPIRPTALAGLHAAHERIAARPLWRGGLDNAGDYALWRTLALAAFEQRLGLVGFDFAHPPGTIPQNGPLDPQTAYVLSDRELLLAARDDPQTHVCERADSLHLCRANRYGPAFAAYLPDLAPEAIPGQSLSGLAHDGAPKALVSGCSPAAPDLGRCQGEALLAMRSLPDPDAEQRLLATVQSPGRIEFWVGEIPLGRTDPAPDAPSEFAFPLPPEAWRQGGLLLFTLKPDNSDPYRVLALRIDPPVDAEPARPAPDAP